MHLSLIANLPQYEAYKKAYLHPCEEAVHNVNCIEEGVWRELVPYLQATQNMGRSISHLHADLTTILL